MPSKFIPKHGRTDRQPLISAKSQLIRIRNSFPNSVVLKADGKSFSVLLKLRPTPLSKEYDIKINFEGTRVKIYVVKEKLKVANNRKRLPHVYSHEKQQLCLYSVSKKEWAAHLSITSTIIPWTSDWLMHYELWLYTGLWSGGGHNEYPNENGIRITEEV